MAKTLTGTNIKITEQTPEGLVVKCYGGETAPTTAGIFTKGAEYTNTSTGVTYRNGGTTASPSWQNTDEISTSEIASNAITFAKLASPVTTTQTSATPGTVRTIYGQNIANSTMTSGNLVGVRGEVSATAASGGYLYGAQGKLIASGALSGSVWGAGVFGQLDMSSATINAGQVAPIWGDWGTTSGTETDMTGARGIVMTNTTDAILNAQDYRYGNATYLLELAGAGGTLNYYADAGTSAGSAGDATKCAAQKVIKIEINGVAAYIPVFTQNS
jgi:hypothetical protein